MIMHAATSEQARFQQVSIAIAGLMLIVTASLLIASLLHFGVEIPLGFATLHDPFSGAAIPEAVIGGVLAAGAATMIVRRAASWALALGAALFALAGVLFGLSVTIGGPRTGDIAYHITILVLLLALIGLLLSPDGRAALRSG